MKTSISSVAHQWLLFVIWIASRNFVRRSEVPGDASAYLLAADVVSLVGSKGDEAMLSASLNWLQEECRSRTIHAACSTGLAQRHATESGMLPLPVWGSFVMPLKFMRSVRRDQPKVAVVMGADVMDGYYSPVESLRRLIAADILARSGARTLFTGFSFSGASNRLLRRAFRAVHPNVRFALRDPVSARRFAADVGVQSALVADCAFLLYPQDAPSCAEALAWIKGEQAQGRTVVAINLHPLLFKGAEAPDQVASLERLVAEILVSLGTSRALSWMLFPHDDRPNIGDLDSLGRVADLLAAANGVRFHHLRQPPAAAAIKGLVAHVDGVLTGRMHLAIAALGSGVPIIAFAYQAKFSGLLQHFELSDDLLLDPQQTLRDGAAVLEDRIANFVDRLPALRQQVARRLPAVKRLAEANFPDLG